MSSDENGNRAILLLLCIHLLPSLLSTFILLYHRCVADKNKTHSPMRCAAPASKIGDAYLCFNESSSNASTGDGVYGALSRALSLSLVSNKKDEQNAETAVRPRLIITGFLLSRMQDAGASNTPTDRVREKNVDLSVPAALLACIATEINGRILAKK